MQKGYTASIPKVSGFYWAREQGFKYWNLIVYVYNEAPFFQIDTWDYAKGEWKASANPNEVIEYGPLIALVAPDIMEARKDWQ